MFNLDSKYHEYTVTKENQKYIPTFRGEIITESMSKSVILMRVIGHYNIQQGAIIIENIS